MTDLSLLFTLPSDSQEWEAERKRLIDEQLSLIPDSHRAEMIEFQKNLDAIRSTSTPGQFLKYLCLQINENAANLDDQIQYAKSRFL